MARPGWLANLLPGRPASQIRADIQQLLGFGVMRASARLRNPARSGEPASARARLQSLKIEEHYAYRQEISQNAASFPTGQPDGLIKLTLPYDGDTYFTRQAHRDVLRAQEQGADLADGALVGYLVLTGYEHTNLEDLLDSGPSYGSVPIRVPLCLESGTFSADLLLADSRTCVLTHSYRPGTEQLEVHPVDIGLELDDPDTADFSRPGDRADSPDQRLRIMRQVSFQPDLMLRMTVRLDLPRELADGAVAQVSDAFINWPTHTSLRSLELRADGQKHPLRYNPERGGLEWSDIPMVQDPEPASGEMRTFRTPEVCLSIPQPGELYREDELTGTVEVTVNRLLSGMDARLYDATGKPGGQPEPELESRLSSEFSLILDDAFAQRMLSLSQQLHFDEVIPDEMRIDDIKTALKGLGFRVDDPWPDSPEDRWLFARRPEGPDMLRLFLYVEGRRHKSRRDRRVPGGMTYRTELDSGELGIYIYGTLPRDSRPVVRQMNALQRALHERFDRLPARR